MEFDIITNRRGSFAKKWDRATKEYGVPDDNLPMWVADTDFRAPDVVLDAMRKALDHGIFGYGFDVKGYKDAICWWMETRHGWTVDPAAIFTTAGLCNAIGLLVDTYTQPGDGIVLFSPVYHAFARVVNASERRAHECPLALVNDRYELDLERAEASLRGDERMLIFCSPHNPGGRVWTRQELESVSEFARRNDLLIVSDEIHHDIVFPGHTHIPFDTLDDVRDRLIVLTAASKTFNIAGLAIGNTIIPDAELRRAFAAKLRALSLDNNVVGHAMVAAAYSSEGAAWVDRLLPYLDENRKVFDQGMKALPGIHSMPLESTFLSWVDFSGTGMEPSEFIARVERDAGIATNHGATFGPGGEMFLRFNIGTQRARIEEAVSRMTRAFSDLQ